MDEILIDEKKYVSSKQAAKITGYAKDYIGQLCREGRVPARLVGRSWYVLESAIQDHRFGTKEVVPEKTQKTPATSSSIQKTWESPRYEASSENPLPVINRLKETEAASSETSVESVDEIKPENSSEYLEDSWRTWFDRVAEGNTETISDTRAEENREPEEEPEEVVEENEPQVEEAHEPKPARVPIHAIHDLPPKDLLPDLHYRRQIRAEETRKEPTEAPRERAVEASDYSGRRTFFRFVQVFVLLLAAVAGVLGVVGAGFYDEYVGSIRQVEIISGTIIYDK